ncbi:hypothetical protein GCM10027398_26830 [Azotobacter salinestris]
MFSRMALREPPYTPPMKMPTISARALLTSQEKVKETRIDTAMVTDRPGMAPI